MTFFFISGKGSSTVCQQFLQRRVYLSGPTQGIRTPNSWPPHFGHVLKGLPMKVRGSTWIEADMNLKSTLSSVARSSYYLCPSLGRVAHRSHTRVILFGRRRSWWVAYGFQFF